MAQATHLGCQGDEHMLEPTPQERDAFLWMQGRMVELLLRHDAQRFTSLYRDRTSDHDRLNDPRLAHYRELAVLFYLRDELFGSIIPRIKRRLSFTAPREVQVEEMPPRGRIDWNRTATTSWRERPGEVPLEAHTRQRRRHFATPENLLTVVSLLEYRAAAQRVLDAETEHDNAQAIRHPLHTIVDSCTRELVFAQFVGLVHQCSRIVEGYASQTTEDLERAVTNQLLPGRNSAYDDLLDWRHKLASLRLLERTATIDMRPMLGADPDRDNYLYQLWLFYELGDMLQHRHQLRSWDYANMVLTFVWDDDDTPCEYRLQHDQAIAGTRTLWEHAPGVRPDFYIERVNRVVVRDGVDQHAPIIWREPGYVLDAKYYRPRDSDNVPAPPLKRMIADLQLTGERRGALLFAFHGGPLDHVDGAAPPLAGAAGVATAPQFASAQFVQPDVQIESWRLQPRIVGDLQPVHATFQQLLMNVHHTLKNQVDVRCRGVFLDSLSANAHGEIVTATQLVQRSGRHFDDSLDDLLLCPKPHVAPWRVDIVSRANDCCENATLCHIKGRPNVRKPERLTALAQIADAIRGVEGAGDEEAVVEAANRQVLVITRRYAELIQPDIRHYQSWVRDELEVGDLFDTTALLNDTQRETLALARFLWVQIDNIKASNFAGPTLLFTGVLEEITRRTIFRRSPQLYDTRGKELMQTLGTLGKCKWFGGTNWRVIEQSVGTGGYWNETITSDLRLPLSAWIDRLNTIVDTRNHAAHQAHVSRDDFQSLTTAIFGSLRTGMGLLNGLLLAWTDAA